MLWIILINLMTIGLLQYLFKQDNVTQSIRVMSFVILLGTLLYLPAFFIDFLPYLLPFIQYDDAFSLFAFPLSMEIYDLDLLPLTGRLNLMGILIATGSFPQLLALGTHIMTLTNLVSWVVARLINSYLLLKQVYKPK